MSEEGHARSDPDLPSADDASRPSGIPEAKSAARRRDDDDSRPISLRPGAVKKAAEKPAAAKAEGDKAKDVRPSGLKELTTSARQRLQLVLDDSIPPPAVPRERTSHHGRLPLDPRELRIVHSLSRWIGLCGLMMLAVGALTGLSYWTGEGKVAHVVVGILSTAVSVWLLAAALAFRRTAVTRGRQQHHLVNGLGLVRSALLLKAILLFSGMVLGCVTFSLAASLLWMM